jgi:hypothetical protein
MYLREYPEDIAGVCLISPFLRNSGIIAEISAAGSLAAWDPGKFDLKKDWERMLWAWLKETPKQWFSCGIFSWMARHSTIQAVRHSCVCGASRLPGQIDIKNTYKTGRDRLFRPYNLAPVGRRFRAYGLMMSSLD